MPVAMIQATTEDLRAKASSIRAKADEVFQSQQTVVRKIADMKGFFRGTRPDDIMEHLLSLDGKYRAMYENLTQYANFLDNAATQYEGTEHVLTQEAAALAAAAGVAGVGAVGIGIATGGGGTSVSSGASGVYPVGNFSGTFDKARYGFGIDRGLASDKATGGHNGYDFIGAEGDPITSCADGKVVVCKQDSGTVKNPQQGYGYYTTIEYNINGKYYYVTYAHLQEKPPLAVGSTVAAGSSIGKLGQTGGANGTPHLHMDVRCARDSSQPMTPAQIFGSDRVFIDPEIFFNELGLTV
ncbi:MAG: peptidoglycan DD-metalloendopeptidase family protein [Peptococcaceae bacterium]|jgi:murein DD-endopeptidase MepM/ murein hydrolase activator NlpD|nr:peptidoglycan DD-metalloendopeptidase family protein [Peptococcaceae bacterium]